MKTFIRVRRTTYGIVDVTVEDGNKVLARRHVFGLKKTEQVVDELRKSYPSASLRIRKLPMGVS